MVQSHFFLALVAILASVVMFLSPVKQLATLSTRGHPTQKISCIQFFLNLLSSSTTAVYSIQSVHGRTNFPILIVSIIGSFCSSIFLCVIFRFSPTARRIRICVAIFVGTALFSGWATFALKVMSAHTSRTTFLGFSVLISSSIAYFVPLYTLVTVRGDGTAQPLILFPIFARLVNAIMWAIFAFFEPDINYFILIPSCVGMFVNGFLLIMKPSNEAVPAPDGNGSEHVQLATTT